MRPKGITYLATRSQQSPLRGLDRIDIPIGKPSHFFTRSCVRFHSFVENTLKPRPNYVSLVALATLTLKVPPQLALRLGSPRHRPGKSIIFDFASLVLSRLSCRPYLVAKSLILYLRETHHLFPVTSTTNARLIRDSSRSRKSRISSKEVLNFQ